MLGLAVAIQDDMKTFDKTLAVVVVILISNLGMAGSDVGRWCGGELNYLNRLENQAYIAETLAPDATLNSKLLQYLVALQTAIQTHIQREGSLWTNYQQAAIYNKLFELESAFNGIDTSVSWQNNEAAGDQGLIDELKRERQSLEGHIETFGGEVLEHLYSAQARHEKSVIIELHPDTNVSGDKQKLISILTQMYAKQAQSRGWVFEVLSQPSAKSTAGSTKVRVAGEGAYEYLKNETGRHHFKTSSVDASVNVISYPDLETTLPVFDVNDLKIEAVRKARGKGGQNVNKVASTARITHRPTGIVQEYGVERDLHKNIDEAKKLLEAKLEQIYAEKREKERLALRQAQLAVNGQLNRNERRLYTPTTVTDRVVGVTAGVNDVLNGNLSSFALGYKKLAIAAALDQNLRDLQ